MVKRRASLEGTQRRLQINALCGEGLLKKVGSLILIQAVCSRLAVAMQEMYRLVRSIRLFRLEILHQCQYRPWSS